jgi:hypothetical protein
MAHKARNSEHVIPGNPTTGYHSSLQSAYGGVTLAGSNIQAWAVDFTENLLLNALPAKSLTIMGGYNGVYSSNSGQTIAMTDSKEPDLPENENLFWEGKHLGKR